MLVPANILFPRPPRVEAITYQPLIQRKRGGRNNVAQAFRTKPWSNEKGARTLVRRALFVSGKPEATSLSASAVSTPGARRFPPRRPRPRPEPRLLGLGLAFLAWPRPFRPSQPFPASRPFPASQPSRPSRRLLAFSAFGAAACAFSFSAAPRMSPSDAPLSLLPYCATACFSSEICSALIEKVGFLPRSKPGDLASNFWPTWKRSGRCSSRSRPRSMRLMKPVAPSSPTWTSGRHP